MDRRACPSYVAGFDACDPFGSLVEWSGRGPARVQRRRCRSEGVDRSPCDDGLLHRSIDSTPRHYHALPNKSFFTLNNTLEAHFDRLNSYSLATENGDYIMAHEQKRYQSYHQPSKQKSNKQNITRTLLTTLSNTKMEEPRLPKVEELLEKPEQELMEVAVAKQPLKSILNNPLPKTPPQGILKKPKNKLHNEQNTCKHIKSPDGRRRQRAASESDNLYCAYHHANPIPGYDSRLTSYQANNTKRAKDNTGTGYSYGSAIATISHPRSPAKNGKCICKEPPTNKPKEDVQHMHVLRTTIINNINSEPAGEGAKHEIKRYDSATRRAASPALPVSSATVVRVKTLSPTKRAKPKPKSANAKANMKGLADTANIEAEAEDAHSRSPSPDNVTDSWAMETDALLAEIERLEKLPRPPPPPSTPASPLTPAKKDTTTTEQNSVTKLSQKLNGAVVTPKKLPSKDSAQVLPEYVTNSLRTSLFPRVPPYLKFVAHDETPSTKIPMAISKHLKWKMTSITPIVVKKTLINSGFRLVKSECDTSECPQEETLDWVGIWGKHMKSIMFRAIKDGQKMNHFPGTFQIGRKDRLWRNLQKLVAKFGMKEFGIMPKSYVLPHDLKLLKHDWEKSSEENEKWIIKPPASARGTGIKVVSRWTQIPKKRPVVVQRYVSKPYLINGSKFDMRLYVLVTSVHPLRIYLFKDGLARFASMKYTDDIASLNDRYMHLTNYSINRLSKNYTPNEDFAACEGHKWTLQTLFSYLKQDKGVDTESLWNSMKDLVIKTIIAGEASISSLTKANITSRYNCYELFGIDVLLDEDLKPWLLEVNISPSLHSASPLDIHVKSPMVTEVLNIAQFQIPTKTNLEILSREKPHKLGGLPYDSRLYTVYLSKEERDKHIIYTNMDERALYLRDILSTLTPDDVRHLIQAEDELTQSNDMERIFPTQHTHKYLQYLTGPRYYNRLFDAWEVRYHKHRQSGVDLLRSLCDIGYHLEVPPIPLKNDVDAPSPPVSERPSMASVGSLGPCPSMPVFLCGDTGSRPPEPPPALEPHA